MKDVARFMLPILMDSKQRKDLLKLCQLLTMHIEVL